ncbi:MAG: 1-acyl-sn-glycerol-3-phosphate acyltransferase [Rhodospirillaceae bacterium]|nr:MAG: 1-acyl-sn-glycerol-3-phosphate acyltransferase [Rhodospirillaceae bacterium]
MLLSYLDRSWRVIATGFAFSVFFGGGALAALTVLPIVVKLKIGGTTGRRNAQRFIQGLFRVFAAMLQGLGVLRLDVVGAERLADSHGHLVIANHPTLLDVVFLMAFIPRAQCIVKHELWNHRYLGGVVRLCGYIPNNLEPEALLQACKTSIDSGDNLIIFPEGTRTRPGEPMRFHRGFANIALLAEARIQLVTILCKPIMLLKGDPWWRIPPRRSQFTVTVGDSLDSKMLLREQSRSIAARALVRHIEGYYGEQLATQ